MGETLYLIDGYSQFFRAYYARRPYQSSSVTKEPTKLVAGFCDILINLLPLTAETRDILNAELFSRLPSGAVLIHVGRGEHLIEADLLAALDSGQLSAASLDVFAIEPLPTDHVFWHHDRIVVTPHDACDSTPTQVAQEVAEAMARLMDRLASHELDQGTEHFDASTLAASGCVQATPSR
mgnify:CR=1 FL=1